MKNKIFALGALLLLMTASSCREQSDAMMGYDQYENLVFGDAKKSFGAKFKVLWNGMNQYYAIWDYEREKGVDWDAIYDECYPQFAALDQQSTVTDDELNALMQKAFAPLHDGHLEFYMDNHKTGSTVRYIPAHDRLRKRPDLEEIMVPISLNYYANVANGEIETDNSGNPIVMEHTTEAQTLVNAFMNTPGQGAMWIINRMEELEGKTSLTNDESFELTQLTNLRTSMKELGNQLTAAWINGYNDLQIQYSFLNIPGFCYIDPAFINGRDIDVKYALLKGNIAYFYLSRFALTSYMIDEESQKTFNMSNSDTQQHMQQVKQVWQAWFDAVQQLHKNGTLGGVIIDVRSNTGGNMNDSHYVVGSLVPAGGLLYSYQRFKRGTGRYEYSPMMPARIWTMSDPHETITEPVVILANCQSVSMSESSVLCVKLLSNGTFIGKRTFGAICALTDNEDHSFNYAGYIGIKGVTPVFGHVPSMASYTIEKKLIEAEGITPDIDVDLDINLFKTTGRDTQLERALQFLRTGN